MTEGRPVVLVTGATCQIGHFLLPRLVQSDFSVHAFSRQDSHQQDQSVTWHQFDIAVLQAIPVVAEGLIHLAPLPLLTALLPHLDTTKLRRVIAFGSTSRYTKAHSSDPAEQAFANSLAEAEAELAAFCEKHGIAWTVFRPTLIYGCGKDKNVTVIARFLRRFRFFPLLGNGEGFRQPVHADDLATACIQAWSEPATFNKGYNLSGRERLRYRTMVERIFQVEGVAPRFLPVPLGFFRVAMKMAAILPRFRYLSMEMVDRMAADLTFDHEDACRDFGFQPRPFEPPAA